MNGLSIYTGKDRKETTLVSRRLEELEPYRYNVIGSIKKLFTNKYARRGLWMKLRKRKTWSLKRIVRWLVFGWKYDQPRSMKRVGLMCWNCQKNRIGAVFESPFYDARDVKVLCEDCNRSAIYGNFFADMLGVGEDE